LTHDVDENRHGPGAPVRARLHRPEPRPGRRGLATLVLAMLEGVLIGGLRSEAERVKRDVERG
jgi:hypothetical protein